MAETVVNELSRIWITVKFKDKGGVGETPSDVSWKVYDWIDGTKLSSGTETPSTSIEIEVTSTVNAIRSGRLYERRVLNVLATHTSGIHHSEQSWLVKNLGFSAST